MGLGSFELAIILAMLGLPVIVVLAILRAAKRATPAAPRRCPHCGKDLLE